MAFQDRSNKTAAQPKVLLPKITHVRKLLSEDARRLVTFEAMWHKSRRTMTTAAGGILVGSHFDEMVQLLALHHVATGVCKRVIWCSNNATNSVRSLRETFKAGGSDFPVDSFATLTTDGKRNISRDVGAACCTYNQLVALHKSSESSNADGKQKKLLRWLDPDTEATLLVLVGCDRELSHSWQSIDTRKFTKSALAISFIQNRLRNARVVYTSCPAKTSAAQLCHMDRLSCFWGAKLRASHESQFHSVRQKFADAIRSASFRSPPILPIFEISIPLVSIQNKCPPYSSGEKDALSARGKISNGVGQSLEPIPREELLSWTRASQEEYWSRRRRFYGKMKLSQLQAAARDRLLWEAGGVDMLRDRLLRHDLDPESLVQPEVLASSSPRSLEAPQLPDDLDVLCCSDNVGQQWPEPTTAGGDNVPLSMDVLSATEMLWRLSEFLALPPLTAMQVAGVAAYQQQVSEDSDDPSTKYLKLVANEMPEKVFTALLSRLPDPADAPQSAEGIISSESDDESETRYHNAANDQTVKQIATITDVHAVVLLQLNRKYIKGLTMYARLKAGTRIWLPPSEAVQSTEEPKDASSSSNESMNESGENIKQLREPWATKVVDYISAYCPDIGATQPVNDAAVKLKSSGFLTLVDTERLALLLYLCSDVLDSDDCRRVLEQEAGSLEKIVRVRDRRIKTASNRKKEVAANVQDAEGTFFDEVADVLTDRLEPLGTDRWHRTYWWIRSDPGKIFVHGVRAVKNLPHSDRAASPVTSDDADDELAVDCPMADAAVQSTSNDEPCPEIVAGVSNICAEQSDVSTVSTDSQRRSSRRAPKAPRVYNPDLEASRPQFVRSTVERSAAFFSSESDDSDSSDEDCDGGIILGIDTDEDNWSVFDKSDQLDSLLKWLNVDGSREFALAKAINSRYRRICAAMTGQLAARIRPSTELLLSKLEEGELVDLIPRPAPDFEGPEPSPTAEAEVSAATEKKILSAVAAGVERLVKSVERQSERDKALATKAQRLKLLVDARERAKQEARDREISRECMKVCKALVSATVSAAARYKKAKKGLSPRARKEEWVMCETLGCGQWRLLPGNVRAAALPDTWQCSMNTWDAQMLCGASPTAKTNQPSVRELGNAKTQQKARIPSTSTADASIQASAFCASNQSENEITDDDFSAGAQNACQGVGDLNAAEQFTKMHNMWRGSVASHNEDDGIGDVDLRQMAAQRLIAYRKSWSGVLETFDVSQPSLPPTKLGPDLSAGSSGTMSTSQKKSGARESNKTLDLPESDEVEAPVSKATSNANPIPSVAKKKAKITRRESKKRQTEAIDLESETVCERTTRLSALEEDDAELQQQLEAARTALAGSGGVIAAGTSATSSGRWPVTNIAPLSRVQEIFQVAEPLSCAQKMVAEAAALREKEGSRLMSIEERKRAKREDEERKAAEFEMNVASCELFVTVHDPNARPLDGDKHSQKLSTGIQSRSKSETKTQSKSKDQSNEDSKNEIRSKRRRTGDKSKASSQKQQKIDAKQKGQGNHVSESSQNTEEFAGKLTGEIANKKAKSVPHTKPKGSRGRQQKPAALAPDSDSDDDLSIADLRKQAFSKRSDQTQNTVTRDPKTIAISKVTTANVAKLQAMVRGMLVRSHAVKERAAVTLVQAVVRGMLGRSYALNQRAAITLQAVVRGMLVRSRAAAKREAESAAAKLEAEEAEAKLKREEKVAAQAEVAKVRADKRAVAVKLKADKRAAAAIAKMKHEEAAKVKMAEEVEAKLVEERTAATQVVEDAIQKEELPTSEFSSFRQEFVVVPVRKLVRLICLPSRLQATRLTLF
jgi:hypothetical protein